ncbi:Kinesin- protein 6 [Desmophyllum pertusum]|uniref:Kinesin-like protein n=1 Tax=Desmophyllum pertusum TaxID=174260 RepID=A0A9W9YY39_9CNID|nr:Kinesin- protein 6 [Desmophyllum pertusum]
MVKQGIQIYARAKPSKQKSGLYEAYDDESGGSCIAFTVPKDLADGYINNKREVYKFSVLTGYNGTVFAYGQTGSGKTFTITGGAERYVDRGLIPRSLSYIFEYFEKHPGTVFSAHISYLEIYNENGYDLLDPRHEACKLEDLPKVNLFEDSDNNVHLKNLSLHQASNEEEALNLLFLGDTNRMIAETPMNQASTRSHCIFTIHISSRDPGSATIRRAKLHLVDLAGSERVGKTNVGGTLLTEAKYINLSLHYLEQVIVALSEKSRSHIPYRNSMMTSVLRDSLGGNCMTTMIATCSLEKKNLDESISTCRFAQRVAMIKNDVLLNEEIDPKLLIAQLKAEVQRLKDELAMATGQEYTGELTDDEMDRLRRMVKSYIEDGDSDSALSVGADMRKINYCFQLLKSHVLDKSKKNPSPPPQSRTPAIDGVFDNSYLGNHTEVNKLKELIRQRDNEINILYHRFEKRYWYNSWLCCGCMNWLTRGYVLLGS